MSHPSRTIFKNEIITEFLPPKNKKSNKAIIFASGMPGYPKWDDTLKFYSERGYWTFLPKYRGSWESYGKFLKHSPTQDITDVVHGLENSFPDLWNNKKYQIKNPEIYVIGASFGGPAAVLASKDVQVKKAIAFCPVIDWTADSREEPMDKLGIFVKKAFANGYRFDMKDWNRLAKGEFYNPLTESKGIDGNKLWIIHARDDTIVPYKPSEKFAKMVNCKLSLYNSGNHDIGKKLIANPKFYSRIKSFFSKK